MEVEMEREGEENSRMEGLLGRGYFTLKSFSLLFFISVTWILFVQYVICLLFSCSVIVSLEYFS
jgi:hypothetical protein